ncbi:MAG: arginine repressor [Bacillota bacterium]
MKNARQKKILEIIKEYNVETQEELAKRLKESGFEVTQATVSRDIKELGLIKIATGNDSYKYHMVNEQRQGINISRLSRLLQDSVVKIDHSENLIIIKTLPGVANAIASCIDHIQWPEVIGTVAGDDTILIVVKPSDAVYKVMDTIDKLLQ